MSTKWEGPILRARGADFEVEGEGGLMQMCISMSKLEGSGGMLSQENFKFKSSEMAINASKPANSDINL